VTVTPQPPVYDLPVDIDSISPLTNPSHSQLHNTTNRAVLDLNQRVIMTEDIIRGLTAPSGSIQQARLAAHEWAVPGPLQENQTHRILIPLIWNLTGRNVEFQAAKITVLTPADEDIKVDIVVGSELTGPEHDHDDGTQTSIFKSGTELVIPAGQYFSPTLVASDFEGVHPTNTYVAAFVEEIGTDAAPGADLTIQLNRNL
jgi:hypothetical protein